MTDDDVKRQRSTPGSAETSPSQPQRRDDVNDPQTEGMPNDAPEEPTITFDNGVTLTMSQYEEYIEQQLAWIESLPPITPDSPFYKAWTGEEDLDDALRRLREGSE